jgi:hypothetical protein
MVVTSVMYRVIMVAVVAFGWRPGQLGTSKVLGEFNGGLVVADDGEAVPVCELCASVWC